MRTVCIIQARLGSKRFPNKILADIGSKPMIAHVVERALQVDGVDEVVIAAPYPDGIAIQPFVARLKVWMMEPRCDEDDVLSRYVMVAQRFEATVVVRVTADCPLLDPEESGAVLARLGVRDEHGRTFEYVTNRRPGTDGLDTEAMTIEVLLRAGRLATSAFDREHVTPYIYTHPALFVGAEYHGRSIPRGEKWSVDTPEDLELVRRRMLTSAHIV